ncbi:MAG: magnesium transporter [Chthoniobacteraceae bacterium]
MFASLLEPEIKELIEARNFAALREVFADWPPADLAELISDLPEGEQVVVFRLLPQSVASETFEYLSIEAQKHLLQAMGHEETVNLLNDMSADDRTALLEELPPAAVTQLLRLLSPEERAVAQKLLNYPEDSVGRLMTPDFIAVRDQWTVREVLDFIRANGRDSETLGMIYVTDDHGQLIDDIRIREFLLRPLEAKVSEIRDNAFVALKVTDPRETAIEDFKKYDRTAMPVVDKDGRLVGIVTSDDVFDVLEEQVTEDIQKLGGMEALDEPYNKISMLNMLKKRAPWLIILFLSEMFTSNALGHFEDEIEKVVVLAFFVPLIISSGGNSGSQATTLVIRALALGEVKLRDWYRVMARELSAGLLLGLVLGVVGFFRVMSQQWLHNAFPNFVRGYDDPHYHVYQFGLVIFFSLIGIVGWGTLMGASLPFILRRLGLDPATASAPFVATLVDVTGIFIYFTVAGILLT